MNLTKGQWVTLGSTIGAVILTAIIHIAIREWYQPDVRYEEGSWYRTEQTAVGSLKLHNFGHTDATSIRISASFEEKIVNISTSDPAVNLNILSGGMNKHSVTGVIERLVPDETIYIYFVTVSPSKQRRSDSFISSIKFNGGKGKEGRPFYHTIFLIAFTVIIGPIMAILFSLLEKLLLKKRLRKHYTDIEQAISIGIESAQKSLSDKEFEVLLNEIFKTVSFRRMTVFQAGYIAFDKYKENS